MTTSAWSAVAVDVATGASPATLADVAIRPLVLPLNAAETVDLEILTTNSAALAEFLDPAREIQIWQDDTLRFWGPAVRVEIDADTAQVQCAGAWWYFTRRFFGKADRTNFLTNGDFEDGLTGWTGEGLTPVVDTAHVVEGTRSVRLRGATPGHDTYLWQTHTHTHQFHPDGDELTIAAHVWVSAADYAADAFDSLGLYAERRSSGGTLLDTSFDGGTITAETLKDQWVRLEITVPFVKEGDTVQVRLYPPAGVAWFDFVTLTERESLSFIEADMATIIRGIVLYAQDRYPGFTHGKTDLNINVEAPPTGITLSRTYEFSNHANIAEALAEFSGRRGGVDYRVELFDTVRSLIVSHPHQGAVLDTPNLVFGENMTSFRWSHDRTQAATSMVVLGPGDGPDREEGGASVTGAGPELEIVTVASDGTTVAELDRLAAEGLVVATNPQVLEATCVGILDVVAVGDWVMVQLGLSGGGAVQYRVVAMTIDPANDAVTVTLNLRDPETPEEAMARFPRAVDACTDGAGGVWVVGSDGGVGAYNGATFPSPGSIPDLDPSVVLNAPIVAIVPHGTGGYWLVGADTGIFAFGDAPARGGYPAMIDTEYAGGDRAIIGAEPLDPGGDDNVRMIADDGSIYDGDLTP